MWLDCKVEKVSTPPSIFTWTSPFHVDIPFLAKNLVLPPKWLNFWKVLLSFNKDGGVPTMSDQSIRVAYLGFHMLLYFKHQVFLALDIVFSYYNKDTWKNQNKVINKRNIVFHFTHCK